MAAIFATSNPPPKKRFTFSAVSRASAIAPLCSTNSSGVLDRRVSNIAWGNFLSLEEFFAFAMGQPDWGDASCLTGKGGATSQVRLATLTAFQSNASFWRASRVIIGLPTPSWGTAVFKFIARKRWMKPTLS
jgi:hypothetical protein